MARSRSSGRWLREHHGDTYVLQARAEGYRSRAAYKLREMDDRDRLLKQGSTVVDLGAAPGGWSQLAAERVGKTGAVVALDLLPMEAVTGVRVLQADFSEPSALAAVDAALDGRPVDLVLSDMAPNLSGQSAVDQPRAMHLAELAVEFAAGSLRPGGTLLVKVFQGEGFDALLSELRRTYRSVVVRKPRASRDRSRELYLLALGRGCSNV